MRDIVTERETAEVLLSKTYPFGTEHPTLDTHYYATYNREHVRLVNLLADCVEYARLLAEGVNVSGKPRRLLSYVGGVDPFRKLGDEMVADDFRGFVFGRSSARPPATAQRAVPERRHSVEKMRRTLNDGVKPQRDGRR